MSLAQSCHHATPEPGGDRELVAFALDSVVAGEREAMQRVAEAVSGLGLETGRLERLKTAVAEAAMNAIEHGNAGRPELDVGVRVTIESGRLVVRITDRGGQPIPSHATAPDLDAKLEGLESPRGWGLFLIERMVDELRTTGDADNHTIELVLTLEGDHE